MEQNWLSKLKCHIKTCINLNCAWIIPLLILYWWWTLKILLLIAPSKSFCNKNLWWGMQFISWLFCQNFTFFINIACITNLPYLSICFPTCNLFDYLTKLSLFYDHISLFNDHNLMSICCCKTLSQFFCFFLSKNAFSKL